MSECVMLIASAVAYCSAEAYYVLFLSHGSQYHNTTRFFLFRFKLKCLKNGGAKVFIVTCISSK